MNETKLDETVRSNSCDDNMMTPENNMKHRLVSVTNTPPDFFFENPACVKVVKVRVAQKVDQS